jgi:hypothetical protein
VPSNTDERILPSTSSGTLGDLRVSESFASEDVPLTANDSLDPAVKPTSVSTEPDVAPSNEQSSPSPAVAPTDLPNHGDEFSVSATEIEDVPSNTDERILSPTPSGTLGDLHVSESRVSEDVPLSTNVPLGPVVKPTSVSTEPDVATSFDQYSPSPSYAPTDLPNLEEESVSSTLLLDDDDVFEEPGVNVPTTEIVKIMGSTVVHKELSPADSEADTTLERFFSCSTSVDGIQLKEKTAAILNEFCRSLSSTPLASGAKVPSSNSNHCETNFGSFSESQVVHAGFFDNNDSVPDISIRLSHCNSYSQLLTEKDSFD